MNKKIKNQRLNNPLVRKQHIRPQTASTKSREFIEGFSMIPAKFRSMATPNIQYQIKKATIVTGFGPQKHRYQEFYLL